MPLTRANARDREAGGTAITETAATAGRRRNTARARAAQAEDRVADNPAQGVRERDGDGRARTRNMNRGNLRRSFSVPNLDEGEIYKLKQ